MVVVAVVSVVDPEEEEEGEGSRLEVAVRPEAGVGSEEDRPEADSAVVVVVVDVVLLAAVAEAATKGCSPPPSSARLAAPAPRLSPSFARSVSIRSYPRLRIVATVRPSLPVGWAREWTDGRASVVLSGPATSCTLVLSLSGIRRPRPLVIFTRTFSLPVYVLVLG